MKHYRLNIKHYSFVLFLNISIIVCTINKGCVFLFSRNDTSYRCSRSCTFLVLHLLISLSVLTWAMTFCMLWKFIYFWTFLLALYVGCINMLLNWFLLCCWFYMYSNYHNLIESLVYFSFNFFLSFYSLQVICMQVPNLLEYNSHFYMMGQLKCLAGILFLHQWIVDPHSKHRFPAPISKLGQI